MEFSRPTNLITFFKLKIYIHVFVISGGENVVPIFFKDMDTNGCHIETGVTNRCNAIECNATNENETVNLPCMWVVLNRTI